MENPQDLNTIVGGGSNKIQEPGRGTLILIFGILSIILLGLILGIPAWVMGHKDLKKIDAGIISLKEKGATKAGMICGIIGTFFTTFILIIVIGIAVAVGISLFNSSAVQANRDAVVIDCMNIQSMAMQYYRKPATLGGGNNSFIGFEISNGLKETANGNYSIENINDNTLTIIGVGKETGRDGSNPVKVIIRVNGDNSSVVPNIIN